MMMYITRVHQDTARGICNVCERLGYATDVEGFLGREMVNVRYTPTLQAQILMHELSFPFQRR